MTYNVPTAWTLAIIALAIWDLAWKGFALWKASHKHQKGWFIVLLVLNTAGLLPIFYLVTHMEQRELSHDKALPVKG